MYSSHFYPTPKILCQSNAFQSARHPKSAPSPSHVADCCNVTCKGFVVFFPATAVDPRTPPKLETFTLLIWNGEVRSTDARSIKRRRCSVVGQVTADYGSFGLSPTTHELLAQKSRTLEMETTTVQQILRVSRRTALAAAHSQLIPNTFATTQSYVTEHGAGVSTRNSSKSTLTR